MYSVYWLDDYFNLREDASWPLEQKGYRVRHFSSEEHLISVLGGDEERPSLLIQDLMRPPCTAQIRGGQARKGARHPSESGWSLYDEVMRPYFPEIPVLICSLDGSLDHNRKRADDFNVTLVEKKNCILPTFVELIQDILRSQRRLHESDILVPPQLVIDFNEVNQELIDYLARNPEDLHQVSWANFERLIADLLERMGYEVFRTPLTRDGGVDIWAVRRDDIAETLYAIDAKKYRSDKILGPEPVRAIYGVTQMRQASVGMIVTTARFGPEALALASQYRHQLSLKDFEAIRRWLEKTSRREPGVNHPHNTTLHRTSTALSRGRRR